MAEASIPVDLFNPGQVFACLGFLEAADTLLGGAQGAFRWNEAPRFFIRTTADSNPIEASLRFLSDAAIHAEAPARSPFVHPDSGVRALAPGDPFPFPIPESAATLPAILCDGERRIRIDHWGDSDAGRDDVKFWGGAAGQTGAELLRKTLDPIRARCVSSAPDPFSLSIPMSNSFRFDWRRDYIPIDAGFSLNKHQKMQTIGYPLVEIFAAIGLSNARPRRARALDYTYAILGDDEAFFDPPLLRAALGASRLPFSQRFFRMRLGWPAQEGQMRCITTVTEEISQ